MPDPAIPCLRTGLVSTPMAPNRNPRPRSSSVVITCTGMCRVTMSSFSRSSTRQPSMSGRLMSRVIAQGEISLRQRDRRCPARRDDGLHLIFVRDLHQDFGEARIVFDDQHNAIALGDVDPFVAKLLDLFDRRFLHRRHRRRFGVSRRYRRAFRCCGEATSPGRTSAADTA